jgi:Dehydrogenases with different specificities (related to short-chain alcohol dehydrogenases)
MFNGKTILVTGATSGIGYRLCLELLDQGARVVAVGRSTERLAELSRLSGGVRSINVDLTDMESYPSKFDLGEKIDGLVCSAGIYETTLMRYFSVAKHENIMRINLTAPLALIAELLKNRNFNTGTSIVFMSSILGPVTGLVGSASYAASKAALVGCAKTLALELAKYSIRVNCVSPGMVASEMTDGLGYMSTEASDADKARYPLGERYATVQEVTGSIRFLLSDAASFITGTNIIIDGGCSAR